MNVKVLIRSQQPPWSTVLVLAWLVCRCATTHAQGRPTDPAANRNVQAIPLQTENVDGQTSWMIEPEVPRIPKIAGLNPQLPPHIERRLSYAFDLAQRGAPYTAEAEFRAVLGLCALEMDAREGGTARREALRDGLVALQEADQFGGDQVDWRDAADVRPIALGHTTPVLANARGPVDSIQAVQAYYLFAEQRLVTACRGLPGASLAFYGLGRTIVLPGTRIAHASGKAALFQRVALAVAPQNLLAANELGVLLAQHGQLKDAEKIFQQCVATDATPETWRNLAVVYARQGNAEASRSAWRQATRWRRKSAVTRPAKLRRRRCTATRRARKKTTFKKKRRLGFCRNST